MNKKLSSILPVLGFVLFAVPAYTNAACITIGDQEFCDSNGPSPTDTQITPAASGEISAVTPSSASSGLNSGGIMGCNMTGAYSISAGAMAAIGGAYVPVNDAAVTLTTGYLVYKECVLDKMAARLRDNAIAKIVSEGANIFYTGRELRDATGVTTVGPMFPVDVDLSRDRLALSDKVVDEGIGLNGTRLDAIDPAFRNDVKRAVSRNYYEQTRNSSGALACSFTGTSEELDAILRGKGTGGASDVLVLTDSNCIPLSSYNNARSLILSDVAAKDNAVMTRLGWSNGVYDVVDPNNPDVVITPGFLVAGTIQQQLGAGFNMQQNANDLNHMVNQMFSQIGNALINQAMGGLQGLIRGAFGQPSLSQIVQATGQDALGGVANAGLQILLAARSVELSFVNSKQASGAALVNTMQQLRGTESQCWGLIIPKVTTYALAGDCTTDFIGNRTCSGPFGIRVATSTAFSQAVIDANITPLAEKVANEIATSTAAFNGINQLLAQVSAASSPDVQQAALRQLDAMVAQGSLHNQYDAQAAKQQSQDLQAAMGKLVTDTVKLWGDSPLSATDPSSGWCNVNNPDVIQVWAHKWRIGSLP